MRRTTPVLTLLLVVATASATGARGSTEPQDPPTAFVNVNVLPMSQEAVLEMQTVIVDADRIVAVGPSGSVDIPPNARVIDGKGRFLMPGLADMHVHLNDIAQAPIYLFYGITTVLNLRGEPKHLDWKRQIASGHLTAPHIYTAGRYIREPPFRTDEQVMLEVEEEAGAGYDVIKLHGDIPASAYRALILAAREAGLPVTGHAPRRLGLEAALAAGQSLAHGEEFIYSWFGGGGTSTTTFFQSVTVGSLIALAGIILLPVRTPASSRLRRYGLILLPAYLLFLSALGGALPDTGINVAIGSPLLLWPMALVGAACIPVSWICARDALGFIRSRPDDSRPLVRIHAMTALVTAVALSSTILFWIPVAWRGSPGGLEKLARQVHDSGIFVTPNLVAYQAIGAQIGPDYIDLMERHEMSYLSPAVRRAWGDGENPYRKRFPESDAPMFRRNLEFLMRLTAALQKADVPLLAGSDAMNPGAVPGLSLHEELMLLIDSGLTPYEALRAATIQAAAFLEEDFGTVEEGKRADLLLLIGNPLEDPGYLTGRLGVMVAGRWYPIGELADRLDELVELYEREDWFIAQIEQKGLDTALAFVDDEGRSRDGKPAFRESRLDQYAHDLLRAGRVKEAIRIFDLNVRAYPESAGTYESLAEAHLQQEDLVEAIRNYEVSLSLNPANPRVRERLEQLSVR